MKKYHKSSNLISIIGNSLVLPKGLFGLNSSSSVQFVPGNRNIVRTFSKKSAFRLARLLATLDWSPERQYIFCTLTYPRHVSPVPRDSKIHLDNFFRAISKKYPFVSGIWRIEAQRGGHPHYHIIFTGITASLPGKSTASFQCESDSIQRMWRTAIGSSTDTIFDFTVLRNNVGATMYLTAGHHTKQSQVFKGPVGRYWGIHNRKCLPIVPMITGIAHPSFMRVLRKLWIVQEKKRRAYYRKKGVSVTVRPFTYTKLFSFSIKKILQQYSDHGLPTLINTGSTADEKFLEKPLVYSQPSFIL